MATSKDLLFVDPDKEINPFLVTKSKKNENARSIPPNITRIKQPNVLNRVKDFLPLMAAANNKLEKEISINKSDAFDVENIKDDDAYVEMNIGLYKKDDSTSTEESSDSDEEKICKMFEEVTEETIKFGKVEENTKESMITEIRTDKNKNVKSGTMKMKKNCRKNNQCKKYK